MNKPSNAPKQAGVIVVSLYLLLVGTWLILSKQIPSPGFIRILSRFARRPFEGEIHDFDAESGHCYLAQIPADLLSDRESSSSLEVLEDGRPLGPAHSSHFDIRELGCGRYSHWGKQLYFSTSDNSNPLTNGRRYRVIEVRR